MNFNAVDSHVITTTIKIKNGSFNPQSITCGTWVPRDTPWFFLFKKSFVELIDNKAARI